MNDILYSLNTSLLHQTISTFIETKTSPLSFIASKYFNNIYTIELDKEKQLQQLLPLKNTIFYIGKTEQVLPIIMRKITNGAVYYFNNDQQLLDLKLTLKLDNYRNPSLYIFQGEIDKIMILDMFLSENYIIYSFFERNKNFYVLTN